MEAFQPHSASSPTVRSLREADVHPGSREMLGMRPGNATWERLRQPASPSDHDLQADIAGDTESHGAFACLASC